MPIPTTGPLAFSTIGSEAKKPLLSATDLNDPEIRKLPNKKTARSQISVSDFYGRAFGVGAGYLDANFVAKPNQPISTWVTSNLVASTGTGSFAIFSSYPAQYRINEGVWVDKSVLGSITLTDYISVRVETPSTYGTECNVTATMPGGSKVWNVGTGVISGTALYIGCSSNSIIENPNRGAYGPYRGAATYIGISLSPNAGQTYEDLGILNGNTGNLTARGTGTTATEPYSPATYTSYRYTYPHRFIKVTLPTYSDEPIAWGEGGQIVAGALQAHCVIAYRAITSGESNRTTVVHNLGTVAGVSRTLYVQVDTYFAYAVTNSFIMSLA